MFLKRFIFVNWGNIPSLEFNFGPVNLFSGGNGSGKTTAADALQTVMTAAHENLFQYNPGQDETTQRGRGGKRVRTLASYVLGCDDGSYARMDPSDGYLAAVFHPTEGETAEPFTAIIAVRAYLDNTGGNLIARQDDVYFYILPGEQILLSHFVREDTAGRFVTPLDKLQALLVEEFGKRAVEKYDTKRAYLKRFYGALRGMRDSVSEQEAMAAARAFSRFMAYKPVQSIDKFVAEEILERKDLGDAVRSIASQLKTIHGMERDAQKLKDSIQVLEQAHDYSQRYIEHWIEINTLDYTRVQHEYQVRQKEYLDTKKKQRDLRLKLKENENESDQAKQRSGQLHEQLVALEAQRIGVPALQQKDELDSKRNEQEGLLVEQAKQLLFQNNALQNNIQYSENIASSLSSLNMLEGLSSATDVKSHELCQSLIEHGARVNIDFHALMQRDITGDMSNLDQYYEQAKGIQRSHNEWYTHWYDKEIHDNNESLYEGLAKLVQSQERQCQEYEEQYKRKSKEIERLETSQVNYPAYVDRAIAEIERQCPQADPRVLCDHVEFKDRQWQSAFEGYVGGARFSIIVEPEHESQAIRIVRNMPGRDNRARIIQGYKARRDAERLSLEKDSIINVLDFSHAVARDYLIASYGNVLRVDSAEELRNTRRGITVDGMGSGSYSMWRCDLPDAELVFGIAARERAMHAKLSELESLQMERHQSTTRLQEIKSLQTAVGQIRELEYADIISAMLSTRREIQKLEDLLSQLDLSAHEDLEHRLTQLRQEEQDWRLKESQLNVRIGELGEKLRETDNRAKRLSDMQDKNRGTVDGWEETLRAIASVWPDFDVDERLNHADNEAKDFNSEIAENQRKEIEARLHTSERRFGDALQTHNQQCRPGDAIEYIGFDGNYDAALFKMVCSLQHDIDRVFNILKNNILLEKHQQLIQLKDSFNSAFVTHLCHAIHQAIITGQKQIEMMNKELQHHRFGADRETFRFASDWIPEYRDYARFFEEVVRYPALGDDVSLFEAELSKKSQQVREKIMTMLLDEDEQKALVELNRIADYRNYRRYEIYKEVEGKPPIALSEYGTGSGGQLETPAYIIRAAAITSAFRFGEGNNHLRMVLVDEAFSKMDETRSREVIHYLTESLGLQLVFIMPTSKCGPFIDLISNEFIFAKVPSAAVRGQLHTRVLVDRKQCNQEKIKNLWANHRRVVRHQAEMDFMEEVLA